MQGSNSGGAARLAESGAQQIMSRRVARAIGILFAISTSSCLGDVSIEGPSAGVDAGEPSTGVGHTFEPPCEVGQVRCEQSWLERCMPSRSEAPARWTKIEDCLSPEYCVQPGLCVPPPCKPREIRCLGPVPQRCRADLTGWEDLGECESAAHCSLDAEACAGGDGPCCLDVPCQPGELRCNVGALERCRADQTALDRVASCENLALCSASLAGCEATPDTCRCVPAACEAGSSRCEGATLQRCRQDQTGYEFVETCEATELCELGRANTPLSCAPPACAAGGFDCSPDGVLQACNSGQTALDVVQPCRGGAAFCNAGQGRCSDTPCAAGDRACDGRQVLECNPDRSGFSPLTECETAQLCVDDGQGTAGCLPAACPADLVICAGNQLQRCNDGRTAFADVGLACPRADLCSAERQRCDFCVPSRRECTPDNRSSRTCAGDGNSFGPSTSCPLGCIPNTGACQTCSLGAYACDDGQLSRCDDGQRFTPLGRAADCRGDSRVVCTGDNLQVEACGIGCNAARSACNECSGQARICVGATTFRACQPDGSLGTVTACQDGIACSGQGQCACAPDVTSCVGDLLMVCNSSGNALVGGSRCSGPANEVLRTCAAGQLQTDTCGTAALCAAATGDDCPACLAGQSTCSLASGRPLDCVGGQFEAREPCAPGLECEGAGLCRCPAGQLRCDGDQLSECDEAGAAFQAAPACGGAEGSTLRRCVGGTLEQRPCADAAACAASVGGECGQAP